LQLQQKVERGANAGEPDTSAGIIKQFGRKVDFTSASTVAKQQQKS
jgi:hypothetical protein